MLFRSVRLEWKDATKDAAGLPAASNAWQSQTRLEQSEATNRFFDACAVMIPVQRPPEGGVYPSLQMGDAEHPVLIYYYDVTRGPALMRAAGRASTQRTGQRFPARAVYANQTWQVTLNLPALAAGTPLAMAVWNGSQQDRDGRKYFSLWHQTRSQQ